MSDLTLDSLQEFVLDANFTRVKMTDHISILGQTDLNPFTLSFFYDYCDDEERNLQDKVLYLREKVLYGINVKTISPKSLQTPSLAYISSNDAVQFIQNQFTQNSGANYFQEGLVYCIFRIDYQDSTLQLNMQDYEPHIIEVIEAPESDAIMREKPKKDFFVD